jgi:hyperosmotically inducible protein
MADITVMVERNVTTDDRRNYHRAMRAYSFVFAASRTLVCLALVISTILAGGCGRPDAEVKAAIESRFASDPAIAPLELTVSVSRGIAFIGGQTQTIEAQSRAIELARGAAGVSQVVNEMELDEYAPLVSAVKSALAADPLLSSISIDVDARNGVVRLMSDATDREQRERAIAVARSVEGVVDVEDRMK